MPRILAPGKNLYIIITLSCLYNTLIMNLKESFFTEVVIVNTCNAEQAPCKLVLTSRFKKKQILLTCKIFGHSKKGSNDMLKSRRKVLLNGANPEIKRRRLRYLLRTNTSSNFRKLPRLNRKSIEPRSYWLA